MEEAAEAFLEAGWADDPKSCGIRSTPNASRGSMALEFLQCGMIPCARWNIDDGKAQYFSAKVQ